MAQSRVNEHVPGVNSYSEAPMAAAYNALLQSEPDLAEESHRLLARAHDVHGLYIRDRKLCNVIRPRFLESHSADAMAATAAQLAAMFESVGSQLMRSSVLMNAIGASEEELDLWSVDPGYPGFTVTSRLDSFVVAGRARFVEYNAESPASIGFCDCLSDVFLNMPAMQRVNAGKSTRRFQARQALLDMLLWAYGEWGGPGSPTIAIIDWDHVVTKRDFELCADFFRQNGIETYITDPRKLRYHHGKLWLDTEPISLVYRRVLLHELLEHADEARPLFDAYRDGAICLVNSPRSKMLHKKALLALLSDPESGVTLSPEERSLVDEAIPWTRQVRQGNTTCRGEAVDLVRFVLAARDTLALKPSDDYGGKGVVLGWETSDQDWARAVESAAGLDYVVQERVDVAQAEFPVWSHGSLDFVPLLVDTDPLLFRGEMAGILTRVSGNALLNVSAGTGSTTPTFVTETEE